MTGPTVRSMALVFALSLLAGSFACTDQPPNKNAVSNRMSPVPGGQGSPAPGAPGNTAGSAGDLKFKAPDGWIAEATSSSMRVAQYRLPKAEGDSEDASLVVFYFGAGQGGSVDANLDRWIGQMEQPDGRASKEKAKTEKLTVNGLDVTLLDVTGTYTAEMSPGSGMRQNKANYRMRAAVIDTSAGAFFVKLVGPEKTLARWNNEYMSFVKSFQFDV